jgi:hypothetical protein
MLLIVGKVEIDDGHGDRHREEEDGDEDFPGVLEK